MDKRTSNKDPTIVIDRDDIYGFPSKIDVNTQDPKLILTTSQNGVYIYDLRNLNKRLFTFENHTSEVVEAKWSPYNATVFASASADRRVFIMDTSRIEVPKFSDDYLNTQGGLIVSKRWLKEFSLIDFSSNTRDTNLQ